jgi:hypothetical protein
MLIPFLTLMDSSANDYFGVRFIALCSVMLLPLAILRPFFKTRDPLLKNYTVSHLAVIIGTLIILFLAQFATQSGDAADIFILPWRAITASDYDLGTSFGHIQVICVFYLSLGICAFTNRTSREKVERVCTLLAEGHKLDSYGRVIDNAQKPPAPTLAFAAETTNESAQ